MKLEFIDFTKIVSGSGKYVTYNNESYELCIGYFFFMIYKVNFVRINNNAIDSIKTLRLDINGGISSSFDDIFRTG